MHEPETVRGWPPRIVAAGPDGRLLTLIANRLSRTPQGGGTDEFANVPLDVSCISGETSRLSIWVWVPAGTVGASDIYSLFYSVEGVDDGFIYSNGSGAAEPVPGGGIEGTPTNP